jgi:hypothetical protein
MKENEKNEINIEAVIDRLVGDVEAWGESHHDSQSNENLKTLGELYLHIQSTICKLAGMTSRYEGSMNECGKIALDYLKVDLGYVNDTIKDAEENDFYKVQPK